MEDLSPHKIEREYLTRIAVGKRGHIYLLFNIGRISYVVKGVISSHRIGVKSSLHLSENYTFGGQQNIYNIKKFAMFFY